MPPNFSYTRRQYRRIERNDGLRNELAAALWEMRRLRRENQALASKWQMKVDWRKEFDEAVAYYEGLADESDAHEERMAGTIGLLARTVKRLQGKAA